MLFVCFLPKNFCEHFNCIDSITLTTKNQVVSMNGILLPPDLQNRQLKFFTTSQFSHMFILERNITTNIKNILLDEHQPLFQDIDPIPKWAI